LRDHPQREDDWKKVGEGKKTLGDMDKKWEETNDKTNKTKNMKETIPFIMGT